MSFFTRCKNLLPVGALALASLIPPSPFDAHSQANNGVLVGQVRLVGPPPAPFPPVSVKPADAAVCGSLMPDESMIASSDEGLRNVIVYFEGVAGNAGIPSEIKGATPKAALKITNLNCRFEPHVQTATTGSTLMVRNDDNILHNTHAYLERTTTLFNLGLPFQGIEVPRRLTRAGMINFKCDAGHTWMSAYILVLNHKFHTVTDSGGHFRIQSVPAGNHRIKVWHERFGTQTLNARVSAGEETRITVEFKS